jgi:hypothetical protein
MRVCESTAMRGKGIAYDTGLYAGGESTRARFDADVVRREMRIIAIELHCTAVRITGDRPERIGMAAVAAAAAGLEVWFSPVGCDLTTGQLAALFADCAERAERLRRSGARVVLVTGCELSLWSAGFLPGTAYERIQSLQSGSQQMHRAMASMPARLNEFLAETAEAARRRFGGPVSYASAPWEPVDWEPFDVVAIDAYRDASNASTFRDQLRRQLGHGKPLAITEFGCACYAGAADRGGMGWAIVDETSDPPRLDGDYVRDETEQVRYLRDLHQIFTEEGADLAFWFTFACYEFVHRSQPRQDLDLASYGVVRMLDTGPGTGYQGLGWEPKLAFTALAELPEAGHRPSLAERTQSRPA